MSLLITVALPYYSTKVNLWTDFCSDAFLDNRMLWSVSGKYIDRASCGNALQIKDLTIDVTPAEDSQTLMWSIRAGGRCEAYASGVRMHTYHPWQQQFDFARNEAYLKSISFGWPSTRNRDLRSSRRGSFNLHVIIKSYPCHNVDVKDPQNALITGDAVPLDIEHARIWVSKDKLIAASAFFRAMFTLPMQENTTGAYVMREVNLKEILHVISFVYGFKTEVTDKTVIYLLKMSDYLQCDELFEKVQVFLSQSAAFTFRQKLDLASMYRSLDTSLIIRGASYKDLIDCQQLSAEWSITPKILLIVANRLKILRVHGRLH